MGAVVLKDYFAYGMVDASNYPNYIIPYTPISIALLISAALSPIISKLFQRTGYFVTIILSFALFFTAELLLGNYSPAFKLHFYLISLVIILSVNNCVWNFTQMN